MVTFLRPWQEGSVSHRSCRCQLFKNPLKQVIAFMSNRELAEIAALPGIPDD
jgi:hypothetical protein